MLLGVTEEQVVEPRMCPAAADKSLKKKLNLLTGTRGLAEEEEEKEESGIDCVCWSL
jgi:hypothetical protein